VPDGLDDIISKLDSKFDEDIGNSVPGAVVLYIKDNKVYYRNAFGYKDLDNNIRMTTDTIFRVGSISKPISALGMMKLIEKRKISLDDPVEDYLTRWHIPDSQYDSRGVTFRRILNYTSGLSNSIPEYPSNITLPSIEQSLSGHPDANYETKVTLAREPGERWTFSGTAFSVMQLAMEEITGKSFSEYKKKNVFS
jgi:CubicO group peptidase (beta-lactamase class C family)